MSSTRRGARSSAGAASSGRFFLRLGQLIVSVRRTGTGAEGARCGLTWGMNASSRQKLTPRESTPTPTDQRAQWLDRFHRSGLSQEGFARRYGLKVSRLRYWLYHPRWRRASASGAPRWQEIRVNGWPASRAGVRRSACRVAARSASRPSWHVSW